MQEVTCLIEISRGLKIHGVIASRFVTILWLCSQSRYVTAANQWTIVEIELLATVGWKWGCRPFSCRCSQNVTHWQKEICSTSLSKESIPTIHFGYCKHPLPARRRFLRAAVSSTFFALWLHPAHPFVAATGKNLSDAEKQRVWSRSYGLQDLLQCSDCALSCAMWLLHQWTIVEIELLATEGWNPPGNSHSKMGRTCCFMLSKMGARRTQWIPRGMGWKWGCQPFSCRCSQNVTHCKRRFVGHVSFQESIPAIPFRYSKHPLPARSRFLRAAAHSTSSAFSLHYACKRSHPFVEDSGFVSYAEKHWFGHGVLVSKVCSWRLTKCVGIELLAWGGSGAASLFAADVGKMWHTAERRLFRHVYLGNPFKGNPSIGVSEGGITLHQVCSMVASCSSLSLQLQKKPVLHREAEGLVTELWSPGLVKEYSDLRCFHVTAAKQWIVLEMGLLRMVGLKCC